MNCTKKAKMKPLVSCQQVLAWLYFYPDVSSKRLSKMTFGFGVFAANLANVIVSGAFVLKYVTTDLEEAIYALFEAVGFLGLCYVIAIAFLSQHATTAALQKLEIIYRKYEPTSEPLAEANEKSEWIWRMYFKFVLGGFSICSLFFATISVGFCYMIVGHFDAIYVYHPNKLLLPWDQNTLNGYIGEIFFDVTVSEAYFIANGGVLLLLISYHSVYIIRRFIECSSAQSIGLC